MQNQVRSQFSVQGEQGKWKGSKRNKMVNTGQVPQKLQTQKRASKESRNTSKGSRNTKNPKEAKEMKFVIETTKKRVKREGKKCCS